MKLIISISESTKGYDEVWFLGDNFVASTFRPAFKKVKEYQFFTKKHFEFMAHCGSKFENN